MDIYKNYSTDEVIKMLKTNSSQLCLKAAEILETSSDAVKERDDALEKLAAMESQKPAGKVIKWLDSNTAICSGDGFAAAALDAEIYFKPAPADKPAVAVPDDVLSMVDQVIDDALDRDSCKLGVRACLAVAPSHSQQNAEYATFIKEVREARCLWIDAYPTEDCRDCVTPFDRFLYKDRCQSHESEQGGAK